MALAALLVVLAASAPLWAENDGEHWPAWQGKNNADKTAWDEMGACWTGLREASRLLDDSSIARSADALRAYANNQKDGVKFWKKYKAAYQAALAKVQPQIAAKQAEEAAKQAAEQRRLARITTPLTDADFDYTQNKEGKITITRYLPKGPGVRDLVVPDHIQGIEVSEIADEAFARGFINYRYHVPKFEAYEGETFESVTIPSTVTAIGQDAFMGRGIKTLTLPAGLTVIEREAFAVNEISAITLPAGLTSIGVLAFYNNKIAAITIPAAVTLIGSGAFALNNLTEIAIPANVTRINALAFAVNRISKITFSPAGKLAVIENAAFADNRLTSLVLPEGLTTIVREGAREIDNDFGVLYLSKLCGVDYIKGTFGGNPLAYIKIPSTLQGEAGDGNWRPITTATVPVIEWQKPIRGMIYIGDADALKIGDNMSVGIDEGFNNFYASQGKKAGIYIRAGKLWRTGTQAEFDTIIAEKIAAAGK
jgi:hypothetical protein